MEALSEFFAMGGYATYVWTAYGLALFGIGGILLISLKSWKAREREFTALRGPSRQ
ncbi:MAG: heme exporter protein CcmD [Rhodobacteraceae bacterium]|nr:heme exporter protein CcmD [Paracoccaceae bacterium]